MKLTKLKAMRPGGAGNEGGSDRGSRDSVERRETIAAMRFPFAFSRSYWSLSDEECESILLDNDRNRALIERGGTVGVGHDMSDWYTVQWLGYAVLKNGWSIVPQDRPGTNQDLKNRRRGGDERAPSSIPVKQSSGKLLGFAFLPTAWREKRMGLHDFLYFEHMHGANLAIQCCAASGHVRVLDIDCTNPDIADRVRELAAQHLGPTPFIRIGKWPKAQLFYRVEGDDIAIQKWTGIVGDPAKGQSIEWLANGAVTTCYGLHHTTRRSFDWSEGSLHPAIAGPENAPLVTKAMLRKFTNALQQELGFKDGSGSGSNPFGARSIAAEFDRHEVGSRKYWTPRVVTGSRWTTDENGNVTNGAEEWMTAQSWAFVAANAHHLDGVVVGTLIEELALLGRMRLLSVSRDNKALSTETGIAREAKVKIQSAARKFQASIEHHERTGRYHDGVVPFTIGDDGRRPIAQRVRAAERPTDGSLDWIPDDACPIPELAERTGSKVVVIEKSPEATEAARQARAMVEDQGERRRTADRVSLEVRGHIGDWLATVPEWTGKTPARPWVLKAPTGAGKTVGIIDQLAAFCSAHPREPGQGPILLVLPTHANADEAMSRAVDSGMFAPELWTDADLDRLDEDLAGGGVKIVRFRGREAAGCQRKDELRALSDKGIGASRLCGAEVEDGDAIDQRNAWKEGRKLPKVEILCPFREAGACGYYRQMDDLATADIVVLPHAYATIAALPKDLRKPRAVIIDESVTYALLRQSRMPISTLSLPRREPFVTKTDKKMWPGLSDDDIKVNYITGRDDLCSMALQWLAAGKDVAAELAALPNGATLLHAAITMCERANDRTRKVRPDLTPAQVAEIAGEAAGSYILDEIRWWKLVRDRVERLAAGTAKGKRDMRWQVVDHPKTIKPATDTSPVIIEVRPHLRLSWRVEPNWAGYPTLLLDASANPRIVSKLFAAEPELRIVEAPAHGRTVALIERTWSNSQFIPPWDATSDEIKKAAQTLEEARRLITTTVVLYGHGRILVGTTIAVREAITAGGWLPPPNVDFVHFGALRGLDFAKSHVAAISIGRSEQPISVIDGYVAALTFDDDQPEEPYDVMGTSLTREGKPLFRSPQWRRIEMRTGQDLDHLVPSMPQRAVRNEQGVHLRDEKGVLMYARSWGQDLEESWREEEIRQFLGRLRLVYRSIDDDAPPPVWICVGKIIPDGVIIDEITDISSLTKAWPMAELVRLGGGVLADNVTPRIPGAQDILRARTLKELAQGDLPKGVPFIRRWAAPFAHARYRVASDQNERSAMLLEGWLGENAESHWIHLCERHGGELPELTKQIRPALLGPAGGKQKPKDKRDVDRDDQLEDEIALRRAMAATDGEMSRAELELRVRRGEMALPG